MTKQRIAQLAFLAMAAAAGSAHADVDSTASFKVKIQITKTCAVSTTPNDIDLGTVAATAEAVNQTGSTSFKVNCSKNTPFYIGLAPSAANGGTANGTGNMVSVANAGTNSDQVPYTLYSDAGYGAVWGNTATTSSVGNGVQGTGKGMAPANALTFNVYAKATNVDFTPDNYADTVTVNVNY